MSLVLGTSFGNSDYGPNVGMGSLSGWFDDWGGDIIGKGFDFGETFIKSKYAKDASKYTGNYFPQGQTESIQRYPQLPTTVGAGAGRNPDGSLIADTAGKTASSFAKFVEDNLGVLAIGGVFLLAFMRKPGKG